MIIKWLLLFSLATIGPTAAVLAAPTGVVQGTSRIGLPTPGVGDGHMLPGWSDPDLKRQADAIQIDAHKKEMRSRSILSELDQAFAETEQATLSVDVSRKISELDHQLVGLRRSLSEVDRLLARTPAPSLWDATFLRALRGKIDEVSSEMLINRVYFERQDARARLRKSRGPCPTPGSR